MKIYIASGLENFKQVQALRDALLADGHEISYDWSVHGSAQGQGDERLREVAQNELDGVYNADVVVVLLPGGRGTHAELGAANVLGKPVLIFSDNPKDFLSTEATCAFYWNANVYQMRASLGTLSQDLIPKFFRQEPLLKLFLAKAHARHTFSSRSLSEQSHAQQ